MSNPRFTPITSDLLARKGDATPSAIKQSIFWRRPAVPEPVRPALAPVPEPARDLRRLSPGSPRDLRIAIPEPVHDMHGPDQHEPIPTLPPIVAPDLQRPHKMMVTLSHGDYEKLGLAAVKKGITRQQMLRVAVDLHIERLKREFGGCGCLAMGGIGQCGESCGAH